MTRQIRQLIAAGVLLVSLSLLVGSVVSAAGPRESDTIDVLGHKISRDRVAVPTDWGAPLTKPLQVQAAYNGQEILFRLRFPTGKPSIHHNYLVYEAGKWARHGAESVGSVPDFLYEDRVAFHVDDGAVRGFANQGCWTTCHSDLRYPFMYAAPTEEEVRANPYFRDVIKQRDTRKYIPESRNRPDEWWNVKWDSIGAEDASRIKALKEAGILLDQWHWRAYRGGPIGTSDDMYVLDYRNGDEGRSAFADNWDAEKKQPRFMFNPAKTGYAALAFEDVRNQRVPLDSAYFLGPDTLREYDPKYPWKEGDALPYNYLRRPEKSRADISSKSRWADGWWEVELRRKMDTGNLDDKPFREHRIYNLAFAFYTDATGNRFHYVTFPVKLGLGEPAEIQAVRFNGDSPDWATVPTRQFTGFYPGQTSWQFIVGDKHPGAPGVRSDTVACSACHTPEGLAQRSVGLELRSKWEGPRPWTWAGGLLGLLGIGLGGMLLRRSSR
jgi:hypothetical protein